MFPYSCGNTSVTLGELETAVEIRAAQLFAFFQLPLVLPELYRDWEGVFYFLLSSRWS